jgi:transketolase
VHTFAVFICRRAFDQVAMSVAYSNLPVRFLGFLPGITTPGGATHQAIDDVGLMRLLPNMTVLDCGDATEVQSLLDAIESIPGPVYARVLRGEVPRLFEPDRPLRVGRARLLREGGDLCLLSSGICTEEALRGCEALVRRGLDVCHLHVSTLKPFDDPLLLELTSSARLGVVTIENHSVIGGLGSAMAERMAEVGLAKRLLRLGIQDQYAHGASRVYLARKYGLDARALVSAAERLAGTSFDIEDGELESVDLQPIRSESRAEDL